MKIVVCIKQVPDTMDVKINPKTNNLDREGITSVINPFDNNAIEEALRLKEKYGAEVHVVTMGPPQGKKALKKALAMGCDKGYLISDRALGGADTLATGYTLAKAIEKIGNVDIVFCGRQAIDADTGQTGPIIAEFLNINQVTYASELEIDGDYAIITRLLENCTQKVKVKMPLVITAAKELNDPRYATPITIMEASDREIITQNATDIECDPERIGQTGSPSIVQSIFPSKSNANQATLLQGSTEEIAKQIIGVLEENKII